METGRTGRDREAGSARRPRQSSAERAAAREREEQAALERARRHAQAAARARDRAAERKRRSADRPAAGQQAAGQQAAGQHRAGRKAANQADTGDSGESGESGGSGAQELRGGRAEVSAAGARWSSGAGRPDQAELPAGRYLDREESWLRFSERVLELAEDENLPLLERVRFESIFASGLDEFFGGRIAGRIRRMATGLPVERASGKSSGEILRQTLDLAHGLSMQHALCYADRLQPALAEVGIEILRWKELTEPEQAGLQHLFRERIYPVLTPLVVDPAHPFPYISNLSLSLAVMIADSVTGATLFARVKVPPLLPRFLTVAPNRFVPLEDVIAAQLGELFVGMDVLEHYAFRVTRFSDLEIDEDVTENLLQSLERELTRRNFEPPVRLEVEESMSADVLGRVGTRLSGGERAVYRLPGPLDLSGLSAIADLDLPDLHYPKFVPSDNALPHDRSVFSTLRDHDVLVHPPYDSFSASTQRLVVDAAADPRVLAIKQTLYRTSGDSEIVDALIDAAEGGKQA